MWAEVIDGKVVQVLERPRAFVDRDGIKHPASVLLRFTDDELRAIGWYRVDNAQTPPLGLDQVFAADVFTFDADAQTVTRTKTVRDLTPREIAERDQAAQDEAKRRANQAFLNAAKDAHDSVDARLADLEARVAALEALPGPP